MTFRVKHEVRLLWLQKVIAGEEEEQMFGY